MDVFILRTIVGARGAGPGGRNTGTAYALLAGRTIRAARAAVAIAEVEIDAAAITAALVRGAAPGAIPTVAFIGVEIEALIVATVKSVGAAALVIAAAHVITTITVGIAPLANLLARRGGWWGRPGDAGAAKDRRGDGKCSLATVATGKGARDDVKFRFGHRRIPLGR